MGTWLLTCCCCRFQGYASEYDDDVKDLQRRDLTPQQRLAAQARSNGRHGDSVLYGCCASVWSTRSPYGASRAWLQECPAKIGHPCSPSLQLRLGEKRILRGTMDGVRRRLAPIRGIPTKVIEGNYLLQVLACPPAAFQQHAYFFGAAQ